MQASAPPCGCYCGPQSSLRRCVLWDAANPPRSRKDRPDLRERKGLKGPPDRKVPWAGEVKLVLPGRKDQLEHRARREKRVRRDQQGLPETEGHPVLKAPPDRQDLPAPRETRVPWQHSMSLPAPVR